jgi:hypothetical protein
MNEKIDTLHNNFFEKMTNFTQIDDRWPTPTPQAKFR